MTKLVILFVAAIAAVFAAGIDAALADARLCRQLEAQLAAASSGGGGSAGKYDNAIAVQRGQLQRARERARSAGCGPSLFGSSKASCNSLSATVSRMERNLSSLQSKRSQQGRGGSPRDRARLLASLNANGCRGGKAPQRPQAVATQKNPGKPRYLFDWLAGRPSEPQEEEPTRLRVTKPNRSNADAGRQAGASSGGGGRYRTLCVRTCDGYYFPMSGSSSQGDFGRDQQNCEAMCPGAEIQLFYHNATEEESDEMVSSTTGKPYTELPAAYSYRQSAEQRPGCACNPVKNYSIIAGNQPPEETPETKWLGAIQPVDPVPLAKPDLAAQANGQGSEPSDKALSSDMATSSVDTDRKVRVVGPVFLPDPAGAIDLRTPVQSQVQ